MERKEIWVEGTFAGEFQVDEREAADRFSDAVCGDPWSEGDWYGDETSEEDADCLKGDRAGKEGAESTFEDTERKRRKKARKKRNKEIGRRGEQAAARYLEHIGYEVLERNYTCRFGEADIIARDGDYLVLIEVKTRSNISKGFPSEAVDERKRSRYEKIAAWYLREYDVVDIPVRFDVIGLMVVGNDRAFLRHYVNAFGVGL